MKKEVMIPDILKQLTIEELEPRLELEVFIDPMSILATAANNNNNNNNNNNEEEEFFEIWPHDDRPIWV